MKYVFIQQRKDDFNITTMSRMLQVSRSGYYGWCQRQALPSARQRRTAKLDEAVKNAFEAEKGRSGSPRLTLDLADAGTPYDRKTVANSLRRQGLRAKAAKIEQAITKASA